MTAWARWVGMAGMLAVLPPLAGCGDATVAPEAPTAASILPEAVELTLAPGQEARPGDGALRVVFLRVVEDSRCPADVTCVWEGNAVVEVGVARGSATLAPLQLNSTLEPGARVHDGFRVSLLGLDPLPASSGPPPTYTLRVRVEAVDG